MGNETAQYQSIGDMAFGAGVIDEVMLAQEKEQEAACIKAISEKHQRAGDFCENVTVRTLYTGIGGQEALAGNLFYYDVGMTDSKEFDVITDVIGKYLNRPDVKEALHAGNATWVCADETGPVAAALRADFTIPSAPVVASLLETGKRVTLYNGVRDLSVCNHIGNLQALLNLNWKGANGFRTAKNVPWPSVDNVMGYIRSSGALHFATVLRTGHLVPTVVPESFAIMLDTAVSKPSQAVEEAMIL